MYKNKPRHHCCRPLLLAHPVYTQARTNNTKLAAINLTHY